VALTERNAVPPLGTVPPPEVDVTFGGWHGSPLPYTSATASWSQERSPPPLSGSMTEFMSASVLNGVPWFEWRKARMCPTSWPTTVSENLPGRTITSPSKTV